MEIEPKLSILTNFAEVIFFIEKVSNVLFYEERTAQDSHNFVSAFVDFELATNDVHKTKGRNGNTDLYSHRVLVVAPEGRYAKVLFHPLEERLYLPAVLVKESHVLRTDEKVVCVVDESPAEFFNVIKYAANSCRIIHHIALGAETHHLVGNDVAATTVILAKQVLSKFECELRLALLPYHEESSHPVDMVQSLKVVVPPVEYVASVWLIGNCVHCVNVVYYCVAYEEEGRNLEYYVKHKVYLDARFPTSEFSPIKDAHTQVDGGRVKCVILSMQDKISWYPCPFRHTHHLESEFFKHLWLSKPVRFRKCGLVGRHLAEPQVVGFRPMGLRNVSHLPDTLAAVKLGKDKYKQLIPISVAPSLGLVSMSRHKTLEITFGKKIHNLTKDIFAAVHKNLSFELPTKVVLSNVRQGFERSAA